MHDATAVAYYLHPELFETCLCTVETDCKEEFGKTKLLAGKGNVLFCTKADRDQVVEIIAKAIRQF